MIQVEIVPALKDNYCYLVHRTGSNVAVVIDPSEPDAILSALRERKLDCRLILNTHHHFDHVGGNTKLSETFNCPILCSAHDLARIPQSTRGLTEGEHFDFDGINFEVWEIPGHTLGQLGFYVKEAESLFVGDTVFAMGCGRLYEGTPAQMLESLQRILKAPSQTRLRVGHEYTRHNGGFAKRVEPSNTDIETRIAEPVASPTIADELKVNPFFRLNSPEIRNSMGCDERASELEVFTRLREARNTY